MSSSTVGLSRICVRGGCAIQGTRGLYTRSGGGGRGGRRRSPPCHSRWPEGLGRESRATCEPSWIPFPSTSFRPGMTGGSFTRSPCFVCRAVMARVRTQNDLVCARPFWAGIMEFARVTVPPIYDLVQGYTRSMASPLCNAVPITYPDPAPRSVSSFEKYIFSSLSLAQLNILYV